MQPDTLIPNPSTSQSWNRYSYVYNRPVNFNDPTGHTSLCNAACEEKDERKIPTIAETLSKYGVTTKGDWTATQQAYLLAGILNVAKRLAKKTEDPSEAFKSVYGITSSDPLVFVMGSCDARGDGDNKYGGCADKNGDKAGAYTWSSHEIEFYSGAPFAQLYGNRTRTDVYNANVHLVVHELGHAFASRLGKSPNFPYLMVDQAKFNDLEKTTYLSSEGFRPAPSDSIQGYWQPNTDITRHETFANMFLGWVFNAWANNSYGQERSTFMSNNMSNVWLPALTP